ncbi:unnamed protein product [Ixodes pacificus]
MLPSFIFIFANVIQTARVQQFLPASSALFDVSGGMRPVRSKRASYRRRANDHNLPIPASLLPIPFCSSRSNFQTPLPPPHESEHCGWQSNNARPAFFLFSGCACVCESAFVPTGRENGNGTHCTNVSDESDIPERSSRTIVRPGF